VYTFGRLCADMIHTISLTVAAAPNGAIVHGSNLVDVVVVALSLLVSRYSGFNT
jgi:hypothetical protein